MNSYIVLLRGINVSGHKKIKMAELRTLLSKKFDSVQTYIQSGNIVLETPIKTKEEVAEIVKTLLLKSYGWEIPTIVKLPAELKTILHNNPYKKNSEEDARVPYVCLCNTEFSELDTTKLQEINFPNEYFTLTNEAIYLYSKVEANKSKLSNNLFEKKLQTECTTRNWRTMNKLLELTKD